MPLEMMADMAEAGPAANAFIARLVDRDKPASAARFDNKGDRFYDLYFRLT